MQAVTKLCKSHCSYRKIKQVKKYYKLGNYCAAAVTNIASEDISIKDRVDREVENEEESSPFWCFADCVCLSTMNCLLHWTIQLQVLQNSSGAGNSLENLANYAVDFWKKWRFYLRHATKLNCFRLTAPEISQQQWLGYHPIYNYLTKSSSLYF